MSVFDLISKLGSIDADAVLGQAQQVTEVIARLQTTQQEILQNQLAMMAFLGMEIPPPDANQLAIIEAGTREFLKRQSSASRGGVTVDVLADAPLVRVLP